MSSPIQPKTDDQFVNDLRQLKDAKLEELVQQAPEIAQRVLADLENYPQYQTAEVLREGFKEFKREVTNQFSTPRETQLVQLYLLGSEVDAAFHSPSLEKRVFEQLVASH
ncbi:MAG: hypothetical protein K940chlam7_01580 [Chlamydiae bacterium]|nr:hypothetical protein [Chlamydiota bacterium]